MTAAAGAPAFDALILGGEIQRRIGVKTSRDEPLARFTTMRVGGHADLFAVAHNAFELRGLVKFARSRGVPHVVLGRGSNVVIADTGIRGLVIQNRAEGAEIREEHLIAESGVPMARAATETQREGLSGLEFGLAIPGTVGGAIWANAGAHESDVASVLESVLLLTADGAEVRRSRDDLEFGYRTSRFKRADAAGSGELIVSATFLLRPASADEIKARLEEIKRWRQAHQPLGIPSAGSFFRNPPEGPSAGALIDQAGLKGTRVGGASVSAKHANFLVNDGHGTAADVRRLGDLVGAEVERRFGVRLLHEVAFLGDWADWGGTGAGHPGAEPLGAPA